MTLKALQAEWLDFVKAANKEPERTMEGHCFRIAASALTPHILQQERDRELIRSLYMAIDFEVDHPFDEGHCELCRAYYAAESRLKEME